MSKQEKIILVLDQTLIRLDTAATEIREVRIRVAALLQGFYSIRRSDDEPVETDPAQNDVTK